MNEFSATWLRLREAVDLRSRSRGVAHALMRAFAGRTRLRVLEVGCGTGSNLRATAPLLGSDQHWTLLDNDAALLDQARQSLRQWADTSTPAQEGLVLDKDGRRIVVRFRRVDVTSSPGSLLGDGADLVTASAFFDLASEAFIRAFSASVIQAKAAFHTVLTYDGRQSWKPGHPSDEAVRAAFNVHQITDKGFGPAAGPGASAILDQVFTAAGYRIVTGDSTWCLREADRELMERLNDGVAVAVEQTGLVAPADIAAWRRWDRYGGTVGHRDILALPAPSGVTPCAGTPRL